MRCRNLFIAIAATLTHFTLFAQQGDYIGMAYYDVDHLYDTLPSQFYNDKHYTPSGRYKWDSNRYRQKIENIAQVIDSMQMPIVALYGVENESVVKDLTATVKGEYAYIHRTQDFSDGLDFALLYYGDIFFPEQVTTHYNAICIEGYIGQSPVAIVINNNSTSLGVLLNDRDLISTDKAVIILGRQSEQSTSRWGFIDASAAAEKMGRGTCVYYDKWQMRHRIATNIRSTTHFDVFIREWLLDREGRPVGTYERSKYYGGYSTLLPIYIYFDKMLDFSAKKL